LRIHLLQTGAEGVHPRLQVHTCLRHFLALEQTVLVGLFVCLAAE